MKFYLFLRRLKINYKNDELFFMCLLIVQFQIHAVMDFICKKEKRKDLLHDLHTSKKC